MRNYLIVAVAVIVAGAYFFGARIARIKCVAAGARAQSNEIINITNTKKATDEKVFNTGMRDVRRILRAKYTIAE